MPDLVLIQQQTNPFTGALILTTRYGDVSASPRPERDPRVLDWMMPEQPDPENPGFGYTGRLLDVKRAILLASETYDQIKAWQRERGTPWPLHGMATTIDARDVMTIAAANGSWQWHLLPAYWPERVDHPLGATGWWVGVGIE